MIEIRGYKIKGASLIRLESVFKEARQAIYEATKEEYHRMLSAEVADIVDDVAMGLMPRPGMPILAIAEKELQERIDRSGLGFDTEYNLKATVAVMTDGKDTYLILYAKNAEIIHAFENSSKSGALINFNLVHDDRLMTGIDRVETPESKKWEHLKEIYGDNVSQTGITANLSAQVRLDVELLAFPTIAERAQERARYDYTNRMLAQYSVGREIHPHKLMRLTDQALAATITEDGEEEIERMTIHLASMLPSITLELITARNPNAEGGQQDSRGLPSINDVLSGNAQLTENTGDEDCEKAS